MTNDQLVQFFSGYFHEDWDLDADTPEAVVAMYVDAAPASTQPLAKAIRRLLATPSTDKELSDHLFTDLGCYYDPEADGLTTRAWLLSVAQQLETGRP